MGWVVAIGILLVLFVLLFAPVEARAALRRETGFAFTVRWLGIPLYRLKPGEKRPKRAKAKASPKTAKPKKKGGRPSLRTLWRMGRAGYAAARTPGVRELAERLARRGWKSLELVKAHLIITAGVGDAMVDGLVGASRPKLDLREGRIRLEWAPDLLRTRFPAEGEIAIQTRPIWWIVIALDLLCSQATWRARRVFKDRMKPKAPAAKPADQ